MKKLSISTAVIAVVLAFSIPSANAVGKGESAPAGQSVETVTAFINHIDHKEGKLYLTVDDIQWFEGAAADEAFLENEPDSGMDGTPDGYYIVNSDNQTRAVEIDPDAQVEMQIYDQDGVLEDLQPVFNQAIPLEKFNAIFGDKHIVDLSAFPYHLTIKDGKVVRIVQQYIP